MSFDDNQFEVVENQNENRMPPAVSTPLTALFSEYDARRQEILELKDAMATKTLALAYYFEGYSVNNRDRSLPNVASVFTLEPAIGALNATFWARAMDLTDVLSVMPAKDRNEWNENIRSHKTPEFERETVIATMTDLLNSRSNFFAQKVDGLFQALSREHVTNCPQGFYKRMIINYMRNSYGGLSTDRVAYIHDLRSVIATFMGRDFEGTHSSYYMLDRQPCDGKWHYYDGYLIKIRLYKCGTAHLEVHPDMALRLNQTLAHLHPAAIPSEFRVKPKKVKVDHPLRLDLLSRQITGSLERILENSRHLRGEQQKMLSVPHGLTWEREAKDVLRLLGGVEPGIGSNRCYWEFACDPRDLLREVIGNGCVPDQVSHQFYPTPDEMAAEVVELADIGENDTVLEPSSGACAIAKYLPKEHTTCVEVSRLHCKLGQSLGYKVIEADFLRWQPEGGTKFTRICMNPPFSDGRARSHVEKAVTHLAPKGVLTAVLPAGMRNTTLVPGAEHTWSEARHNEFRGASVSVVLLKLVMPA